jgi:hypothetical protein
METGTNLPSCTRASFSHWQQHHIVRIHLLERLGPITSAGNGFHSRKRLRVEDLAAPPFSQLADRLICGIHPILRQQSLKSGHLWVVYMVYKAPTFGCRQTSGMRGPCDSRTTTRQGQARKEGRSSGPGPRYRGCYLSRLSYEAAPILRSISRMSVSRLVLRRS